ncbi:thioesterase family protein [Marinobacteraceae bacterium S3BR75-40.1]
MTQLKQTPVIRTSIQPRFSDFDALGHLNNAKYLEYVEVARIHAFADVLGVRLQEISAVMGTATINFLRPVQLFEKLVLETAIVDVRHHSIDLRITFRSDNDEGAPKAIVEARQVVVDAKSGKVREVPDFLKDSISSLVAGRLDHPAVGTSVLI